MNKLFRILAAIGAFLLGTFIWLTYSLYSNVGWLELFTDSDSIPRNANYASERMAEAIIAGGMGTICIAFVAGVLAPILWYAYKIVRAIIRDGLRWL